MRLPVYVPRITVRCYVGPRPLPGQLDRGQCSLFYCLCKTRRPDGDTSFPQGGEAYEDTQRQLFMCPCPCRMARAVDCTQQSTWATWHVNGIDVCMYREMEREPVRHGSMRECCDMGVAINLSPTTAHIGY